MTEQTVPIIKALFCRLAKIRNDTPCSPKTHKYLFLELLFKYASIIIVTNVQNEKAFLQILNGRLSGIALLKANSSQTIWKKRNLNQNGNLVDEDCND